MSDNSIPESEVKRDDPMLAAEYSLGLLEGEELLAARGKLASDGAFASRKDWWDNWFVPLTDDIAGVEPGGNVWARIEAEIGALAGEDDNRIVELQSKVRRWQWTAGLTSAAAAIALAFVALPMGGEPVADPSPLGGQNMAAADPLMATVPIGDSGLRLDVTYIPESERMMVTAIGLSADGVHDHELWLVPADGSELQSLGVVSPGEVRSMELPADIARNLGEGVELVLTREPIGGKPEGEAAGPVVAQGAFLTV